MKKFFEQLRDPKQRKLFAALIGGKMLGLALCFVVIFSLSAYLNKTSRAHAQDTPAEDGSSGCAGACGSRSCGSGRSGNACRSG